MYQSRSHVNCGPRGKLLTLSAKQRVLLHRLLHRDLRKCSISALVACQHAGWTTGPGGGHELTTEGRRVAELSESNPADVELAVELA